MSQNHSITEQTLVKPITIDLTEIVKHGDSPTAIILAIAVYSAVLLNPRFRGHQENKNG